MADDKTSTVASPVKVAEEKEVLDGVEVGTTTPAKSPVKANDSAEAPTNGSPEKREGAKDETTSDTPNGDSNVEASEPVCPVKRKSGITKDGEKDDDVTTPEKKAKKDDSDVVEKETASA